VAIFVFLVLHQVGAHFTYPEVPLPAWIGAIGTVAPETSAGRNHYDRIAHFAFGLHFTYPLLEVAVRMAGAPGFWRSAVPVCLVVTTSVFYEFIEWFFALTVSGAAGVSVLGTQGSSAWDTHWDLLLATGGSLTAAIVIALWEAVVGRRMARLVLDPGDSLRSQ